MRNLQLYHQIADPGDLIFLVSDGVHDNLDPQQLGTTPSEAEIANTVTWEEAEKMSPNAVAAFKDEFRMKWLQDAFHPSNTSNEEESNVTPQQIVDVLLRHAVDITRPSRDFMEQYPQKRLPQDYKIYPGKMDHVSCVCVSTDNQDPTLPPPHVTVTAHLSADKIVDTNINNFEGSTVDDQAAILELESTLPPPSRLT